MTDEIYETPSTTPNFRTDLAAQLADLIPEAIADGKVDVEKLKELLDGDAADRSERFGLFWPGKKRALRAAQEPTTATLKPDFENSKDWETTKNVFIEGDNLEVLKILQKHYHAKIKMIYIDPPYNTGKDFVYPDNYKEGLDTYLEWTRQVNEEGKKVSTNAETEGRYHSNWLNMMYPRLKLARNLLTDDGVIFISIDSNEIDNLLRLAKEVFGEKNQLPTLVWVSNLKGRQISDGGAVATHEYIVCLARNAESVEQFRGSGSRLRDLMPSVYKGTEYELKRDSKGEYVTKNELYNTNSKFNELTSPTMVFRIHYNPTSGEVRVSDIDDETSFPNFLTAMPHANSKPGLKWHAWRWSRAKILAEHDDLEFDTSGNRLRIRTKIRDTDGMALKDLVIGPSTVSGQKDLEELGMSREFDTPKPVALLETLILASTSKEDIVLDFFSGSATTGQAVTSANSIDGHARRYIQVQLPEPVPKDSVARRNGLETLADVARKRLAEVGNRYSKPPRQYTVDTGFRAYTLVDTNFAKWRASSDVEGDALQQHLLSLRDSATDDATVDDLLTEILLKQGYSLTEAISPAEVGGLDVRLVRDRDGDVAVLAYLNEHVKPTLEQLRALVDESPTLIIVLEDAFQGDDELKTNLAQLCKSKGIELWTA